jgi:hypothetical protein
MALILRANNTQEEVVIKGYQQIQEIVGGFFESYTDKPTNKVLMWNDSVEAGNRDFPLNLAVLEKYGIKVYGNVAVVEPKEVSNED